MAPIRVASVGGSFGAGGANGGGGGTAGTAQKPAVLYKRKLPPQALFERRDWCRGNAGKPCCTALYGSHALEIRRQCLAF
jgi:hypothetical protein